jgi:hypothetical protein
MAEQSYEETARIEVRPGLTMIRRRTLKDDGRYLVYYDFERPARGSAAEGETEHA